MEKPSVTREVCTRELILKRNFINSLNERKHSLIIHLLRLKWDHTLDTNHNIVRNAENISAVLCILGLGKIHIGGKYKYTQCSKLFTHFSFALHARTHR